MENKISWSWALGRAARLQLVLVVLIGSTLVYSVYNLIEIKNVYQQTGSFGDFLNREWKSGRILTEILDSGLFQLFILALGWTTFFRMRQQQMSHLRLRRSEQKYRSIINHAGEAIFLLDQDGRVLEWNKAAERVFFCPAAAP